MRIFTTAGDYGPERNTARQHKSRLISILSKAASAAVWLLIWFLAAKAVDLEVLVPPPAAVLKSLGSLIQQPLFWKSILYSICRVLAGFILASAAGTVLAVLTYISPFLRDFFYPMINTVKATPVASFIILALMWFATGRVPVFICFLMVLPTVWTNLTSGLNQTDPELLEMGKAYHFNKKKMMRLIYIPSVFPYFQAALSAGIGMAWKAGVAAEVIGRPEFSIGKELYASKIYIEMPDMFAWTLVVILISMVIEKVLVKMIGLAGGSRRRRNEEAQREK